MFAKFVISVSNCGRVNVPEPVPPKSEKSMLVPFWNELERSVS